MFHQPRFKQPMRTLLVLAALCGAVREASAHDFWIQPARYAPPPGSLLGVELRVGDHGQGELVARDSERIERFVLVDGEGERSIPGREGANPAGIVRVGDSGTAVLGFRSHPSYLELAAEPFEQYLREEGLDGVLEERAERGEHERAGRERYARCAKAIVYTGGEAAGHDRLLGFPLELVPKEHPSKFTLAGGTGTYRLSLLRDDAPLAGALVEAISLAEGDAAGAGARKVVATRTDASGVAVFELPGGGRWLFAAVSMERVEDRSRVDWESQWASLTVELANAPSD